MAIRRWPSNSVIQRETRRAYARGGSGLSPLAHRRGLSGVTSTRPTPTFMRRNAAGPATDCANAGMPMTTDLTKPLRPIVVFIVNVDEPSIEACLSNSQDVLRLHQSY